MSGTVSNNISQGSGSITAPSGGVEIRSDDPTLSEGLMWYNTTANALKVARQVAAFSSGGALSAGTKYGGMGDCGTVSSALASGGHTGSGYSNRTEEYNGSTWSSGGNYFNSSSGQAACGAALTAVIAGGGYTGSLLDECGEYNGTAWTEGNDFSTARSLFAMFGIQTAAVGSGGTGHSGSGSWIQTTEEYDGTNWSSGGNQSAPNPDCNGAGTLTAGFVVGGGGTSMNTKTQEYNGTAFTTVNDCNTGTMDTHVFGTQTDARMCAGYNADASDELSRTETYDGTSWSTDVSMSAERYGGVCAGSGASSGVVGSGDTDTTAVLTTSEEIAVTLTARSVTAS